jgi:hypothetical protein
MDNDSSNPFTVSATAKTWFVALWLFLGVPFLLYMRTEGSRERARVAAEIDKSNWISRTWQKGIIGPGDHEKAAEPYYFGGFCGSIAMAIPAAIGALLIDGRIKRAAAAAERHRQQAEQADFDAKMQASDRENASAARDMTLAQSKREVITKLGTVDQFIRVLQSETDQPRRSLALQAAQGEIVAIAARLASGELASEVVTDPSVSGHANETLEELRRLGLSDDRLTRDIRRVFRLTPETPADRENMQTSKNPSQPLS